MSLFDVTYRDYYVNPKKAESSKHIKAVRDYYSYSPKTFPKILRIMDNAIASVKPSKRSKLVWTKTGALFGHSSDQPLRDVEYVWEKVIAAVGDDRNCLIAMGALFRWRISLRSETWLAFRQDSEVLDPDTGRKILVSTYWIDDNYVYPGVIGKTRQQLKEPATFTDLKALADKFNVGRL